jgi:Domain of unknown function (DUF4194)
VNWSEEASENSIEPPPVVTSSTPFEVETELPGALYRGDSGELTLDTRRTLVHLLSGPSLEGRRHGKLWPVLIRDEEIIRKRLSELFLELVIDRDAQVAFTRQADTGELEVPLLLRRSQLTFIDSILLLGLRQRLTQADSYGERAVVSTDEIMNDLMVYERAGSTDRASFTKKVKASVEKFKDRSILQKIRSTEDRFEISPTLKLLFSADRIESLTKLYQSMSAGETAPQDGSATVDDEQDEGAER